jgi:ADP-heptose:LPS heptosyltransferase
MITPFFRKRWNEIQQAPDADSLKELAYQVSQVFLDRHFYNDCFEDDYVQLLCEMGTFFEDENFNVIGSSALFGGVVERLCDEFEELQTEAYNRLMSYVVTVCREHPQGKRLDERMRRFQLHSHSDIYLRAERLRKTSTNYRDLPVEVKKVLVVSRVTIGADIAVTSVLIQRLAKIYPDAEIVLLGNSKLRGLYSANPRIRILETDYVRHGGLIRRLRSWFDVLEAIDNEISGLNSSEILVLDPDSRLSQLGILPLVEDSNYLFFNSRRTTGLDPKLCISEIANQWFNMVTASQDFCYPAVWLPKDKLSSAANTVNRFRDAGCKRVISINLGVGDNCRKRISSEFEKSLLLELLSEPNTVIFLDKGFGDEELQRSNELIDSLSAQGYSSVHGSFESMPDNTFSNGVVGIEAEINEAAAVIANSDEFIGYDSACQHIAAALEIPTFIVFAGSNNTRFVRRWRPFGLGQNEIIHVDTLSHPPVYDLHTIILRIMNARRIQE